MRILLVDDDTDLLECLGKSLRKESYAVDCASDGQEGSYLARTNEYDLVILDNILPKKTGVQVCQEMRQARKTTPVLMISVLGGADEKIRHLDAGADDYLSKPYSEAELLARVRALSRRKASIETSLLMHEGIQLDSHKRTAERNGKRIDLTPKEFALLEHLMQNKGSAVSRETLLERVWDMERDPFSRTVESHIANLRKKIGDKGRKIISTVMGRGYRLG